jgi:NADH-quinone oxidoreductase subunit E
MCDVDQIIAGHEELGKEHLIPLLQEIQAKEGYVSETAMSKVATAVGIPESRVYGVATFYNQFRFIPKGTHVIEVCRGTACHVKQSLKLAQHLTRKLSLKPNGNSPDNKFTVITVACLGACSIAPVIKLDGEFYGHLDVEKLDHLLDEVAQEAKGGSDARK